MRLSKEELQKVKDKYGVDELWSFSKYDSFKTSRYEWFLHYIKNLPEDNATSAYGALGGITHDIIQDLYEKRIKYEDMASTFEDMFMIDIEVIGLKFDRCDSDKNNSIMSKYKENLIHFFKNYSVIPYKMACEKFVTIKVADDIVFQGYIDAVYKDSDGVYNIIDYKTSTKYSGEAIKAHAAQLVLYSEALRQMGVPKDKIRCGWNFLKYVNVDCTQVNGTVKTRTIERREIGNALQSSAKTWLKKLGYEDKMQEYLAGLLLSNDIAVLPDDVLEKFKVNDCYIYIDDIWNLYKDLREDIIETVKEIGGLVEQYNETKDDKLFWDDEDTLKKQSYYFNNLSGYSIFALRPYKEYLDKLNTEKEGLMFVPGKRAENNSVDDSGDDDMSWLNDL